MIWIFLAGCTPSKESNSDTNQMDTATNTEEISNPEWYGTVQPFVAENCSTCHYEGGSAPFSFEQYEDVAILAPVMLTAMQSGSMPPWLPNTDCNEFQDARSIKSSDIEQFAQWIEDGSPMGDPALGESPIPMVTDIEATHSLSMPTGFVPNTANGNDQYRCFKLDANFPEHTFITQTQVKPGTPQVHHVLIYALAPEMAAAVDEANGADGQVGYPCFGNPFPRNSGSYDYGFPTQVGAWVPGLEPSIFPEGTALRIKQDSILVMQVHYSALGGSDMEDSTSYHYVTSDTAPDLIASTHPLAIQDLDIPAGQRYTSFRDTFTNYSNESFELVSLATHMHLLGKSQYVRLLHNDGSSECLLDIPDWDFAWQQSYRPTESIMVAPTESIEVTCAFDNSPENQPFVDGTQIEPADVEWGDGTLDEMCLLYTTILKPYTPLPPNDAPACWGVEECLSSCGDSLSCVLSCESVEFECITCSLDAFLDCGVMDCAVEGLAAEPCLRECYAKSIMMGTPIGSCLEYECPTEYNALQSCADPVLQSDTCKSQLQSCGIPLE